MRSMGKLVVFVVCVGLLVAAPAAQQPSSSGRWFKGNTHTHSLNSDGDAAPVDVVRWYRENGYQFVVMTDHEFITPIDGLNALFGAEGKFLVLSGQEVTARFEAKAAHVNGLGLSTVVTPLTGDSVVDVLQKNIDAIRAAGGVPQVNHPNFLWSLGGADLAQLQGPALLEIWNGHPMVNNLGGGGVPSAEAMWDDALTAGTRLYGVADDDSHHYRRPGDPLAATPGRGWIVVRAERLDRQVILDAIRRGDFYASTGVTLTDIHVSDTALRVDIATVPNWSRFRVEFIGRGGQVLAEAVESPAVYTFRGDEQYVRARIIESNGRMAWTQPVFLR